MPASKGRLSSEEIDAISSAVESFRELHDLTQRGINELIQSDAAQQAARELWKAVCDEVPNIPRRNVIDTCRRKFHNFEARGTWTEEQDEELQRAHAKHPGKWKLIGETLNRFPEDVRDRWRNYLVCGDTMKKDFWDREEEENLRAAVRQCIKVARQALSGDGRDALVDEESLIDWQKISELMGRTRSRLQCRNKWRKIKDRENTMRMIQSPKCQLASAGDWKKLLSKPGYSLLKRSYDFYVRSGTVVLGGKGRFRGELLRKIWMAQANAWLGSFVSGRSGIKYRVVRI